MAYDPAARRERYLRERELKGRTPGVKDSSGLNPIKVKGSTPRTKSTKSTYSQRNEKSEKIARLTDKVRRIDKALSETRKLISEKRKQEQKSRESKREADRENSDGKSSAAEKAKAKQYRDKNRGKIAEKAQQKRAEPKKPSDMSLGELEDRETDLMATFQMARKQIREASVSLKHSLRIEDTPTASSIGVGSNNTNLRKETVKMGVTLDKTPDFGGWATKAGLECADGLTIGHDAFKNMDGRKVPLVFQHGHSEISNTLGHAILENRGEGVYAHCYFNGSPNAEVARHAVEHEDLVAMSIYANRLRKQGNTVLHGTIIEVSLVYAGANPGALIDFVSVQHSFDDEGNSLDEIDAIIWTGEEIQHGDAVEALSTPEAVWNSMTEEQKELTKQMIHSVALSNEQPTEEAGESSSEDENDSDEVEETDSEDENDEEETEEESAESSDATEEDGGEAQHDSLNTSTDLKGSQEMTNQTLTHNVFDQAAIAHMNSNGSNLTGMAKDGQYVLSHEDKKSIFHDAQQQRTASLRDVVEGFKLQHGIENIDILFPDAKATSDTPEWVRRRTEWVDRVMQGAKKTPFSRIKSLSADLTLEQARAKGYIKGALKREEFFAVAKRVTSPQTIYKKQKLDRDDILDITDFDVVVWLKGEMRLMLDEEIARAILIGDGRSNADDDKILEDKIRAIATDHELFQTTVTVPFGASTDAEDIVDAILLNRRHYRGSGNPDFFTKEEYISRMLNVKDTTGRRIYANISELASVLRVNSIIPVEAMEEEATLIGIMVNMVDYTIGTDKGGDVNLFDQFDIDYNQYKYLIEVRCSGALTKPKSALVIRRAGDTATAVVPVAPAWDDEDKTVTVVTTTGITYKNQSNGATLTAAAPVTLTSGQTLTVIAVPASGSYYIASSDMDEFTFTFEDGLVDGPH